MTFLGCLPSLCFNLSLQRFLVMLYVCCMYVVRLLYVVRMLYICPRYQCFVLSFLFCLFFLRLYSNVFLECFWKVMCSWKNAVLLILASFTFRFSKCKAYTINTTSRSSASLHICNYHLLFTFQRSSKLIPCFKYYVAEFSCN